MENELLSLVPKHFLCPYCGEWHEWDKYHTLDYYDSRIYTAEFSCPSCPGYRNIGKYAIYFSDGYCYYTVDGICDRAKQAMSGRVSISSIQESFEAPRVTFDVDFTAQNNVGSGRCGYCHFDGKCNFQKLGNQGDGRHMKITFGFEFDQSDYNKYAKASKVAQKMRELEEREKSITAQEQSLKKRESTLKSKETSLKKRETALDGKEKALQELENALSSKEQEQQQQRAEELARQQEIKEETTMATNLFNMPMEFGPNQDKNIASTLMGVAVKNGDSWRIYNKERKEITDVGDMQLGNLPIFILPTTKLVEGDLIKDAGEYYFVTKVAKGNTQTLCAKTGEMKTIIPIKNIMGFSVYSKVIAFSDSINMGDDFDVEKLAIMSTMCGQPGEDGGQMNQLLPLMLFKDKLGGDDDMLTMMIMSSMMSAPAEGGDQNSTMNQLLPLMLLKGKDGGDDDMKKMVIMSSMMGGNMAGNNPVMGYLMFDMLMGKKKEENAPEQTGK